MGIVRGARVEGEPAAFGELLEVGVAAGAAAKAGLADPAERGRRPGELLIGHPSGITPVKVEARPGPGGVTFDVLGFSRTARRLMAGTAYYPLPATGGKINLAEARASALG